jgi:PIN domain nuclease of toxin-antitoxin system
MRLLLYTHVAIWSLTARSRIPPAILAFIENDQNEVYVSVSSLCEIAIKSRLRRSSLSTLTSTEARDGFQQADFTLLDIRPDHAIAVEALKLDHGDPFDRLILAQAISGGLQLVTKDRKLAAYGLGVISW